MSEERVEHYWSDRSPLSPPSWDVSVNGDRLSFCVEFAPGWGCPDALWTCRKRMMPGVFTVKNWEWA